MRHLLTCLIPLLLLGCSGAAQVSLTNPTVERDNEWPLASLETSGFEIDKMQRLSQKLEAGEYPNAHIVLVEYDGKIVYEKYLAGKDQSWGIDIGQRVFNKDSLHDLRSVSKSVTALLLGIALGDDFESALTRPVISFFPEFAALATPGVEQITLHQVLTMSTGLEWNEMDVPYSSASNDERRMNHQDDPVQYVLTRPVRHEPGEHWYYNGGTTMLIAAVIEKISGKAFLEFAEEVLAEPLGIKTRDVEWRGLGIWRKRLKLPSAASGLRMRARDLAKIGSLMLHDGNWQGTQVVPRGWIRASSQRHMEQTYPIWSMGGVYGYGYQWWHGEFTGPGGEFTAICGVGYGGQRVFVIPEKKLVITIFAGNYGTGKWRVSEKILAAIVAAAP